MRPNSTMNSPLVIDTSAYKTNMTSPLSGEHSRNMVATEGQISQTPGHRTCAMTREGNLFYLAGHKMGPGTPNPAYTLHSIVYDLSSDKVLLVRSDEVTTHYSQHYWGIDLFGDYLYLSGTVWDGGVAKAICRKLSKHTLSHQWTRIWTAGTAAHSYSTTVLLSGDKVYTGSWVWGGGTVLCLNDEDGSIVWLRTGPEFFGEIFEVGANLDYLGTSGGDRIISRRAKSDGNQVTSFFSGSYWWFKGFYYGGHYIVGSRLLHGGTEKAGVSRIAPLTSVVWDAPYDFVAPGNLEVFYKCCTDGEAIYAVGRVWDPSINNIRAIFAKLSFTGSYIWAYIHPELRTTFTAILVDSDYLYIGTYEATTYAGRFEVRSKTNGSIIYDRML